MGEPNLRPQIMTMLYCVEMKLRYICVDENKSGDEETIVSLRKMLWILNVVLSEVFYNEDSLRCVF